jgi:selenide,water dikinase
MTTPDASAPIRLTSLSHGGGCGCKISSGVLAELLKNMPAAGPFPNLLVGNDTSDDAAVYRIGDDQAIVATTDFFMPIIDDPYDFGRIAAANALSDIYAMGGKPLMALALVGMPINMLPHDTIARILEGGAAVCAQAGIPVAGGHSIDSVEPIYGLAAIGMVHPDFITRNQAAQSGDVLILSKPLGVGVLSAALKKDQLDAAGYADLVDTTTRLNSPGAAIARMPGVHAMTDVTGFGLLGHTLELCRGAGLGARIAYATLPWLGGVADYVAKGVFTGASARNWASYGADVMLGEGLAAHAQTLLADPQTSGGLLISCAPEAADGVLALLAEDGFPRACAIGRMVEGPARITVEP